MAFGAAIVVYSFQGLYLGPGESDLAELVAMNDEDWEQQFINQMGEWIDTNRNRLRIVRETATNAVITAHLEQARADVASGDREGFERHCEHAGRLARWHVPHRLDDVERLLEARSG